MSPIASVWHCGTFTSLRGDAMACHGESLFALRDLSTKAHCGIHYGKCCLLVIFLFHVGSHYCTKNIFQKL